MKQMTLSSGSFDRYGKTARRAAFLAEMDRVVPWKQLCALIELVYPKAGNGRPPVGLERMLRIYFLQNWFNLSDPAVEEALYDSLSMREFVGIDLGREGAPDETTACKFRHLLEQHELGKRLFEEVGRHLQTQGMKVSTGTIVDATIINAPSSTKNRDKARDPEMHQTKKGNQWYFGMKAHIGVDSKTKLIHSVVATPANEHDKNVPADMSDDARFMAMLAAHGVNLIFDVGANTGQFGRQLRNSGYSGRIVSFEPLAAAHKQLSAARENDPLWEVAPQAAIGMEDGEIEIHVAGNSQSSSVLDMLDTHANAAPESTYVGKEKVPLRRLDTIASDYLRPDSVLFIKIDTQGYEDRVLRGAPDTIARAVGMQLELSLVPLYEGSKLYVEMIAQLKTLGFELWSISPVFFDTNNGRLLQVDGTFFRPNESA